MFFREGKGACVMRYDFQKFVRYPPGSSGGCKCMVCMKICRSNFTNTSADSFIFHKNFLKNNENIYIIKKSNYLIF